MHDFAVAATAVRRRGCAARSAAGDSSPGPSRPDRPGLHRRAGGIFCGWCKCGPLNPIANLPGTIRGPSKCSKWPQGNHGENSNVADPRSAVKYGIVRHNACGFAAHQSRAVTYCPANEYIPCPRHFQLALRDSASQIDFGY